MQEEDKKVINGRSIEKGHTMKTRGRDNSW